MNNLNKNCAICGFLASKKFQIVETEYWKVDICQNQEYLGRSYVTLKRHCPDLSELTDMEWSDLKQLIIILEKVYKKTFDAAHFNWTCLMNDAYKENPPFPHVHWHLRPRYSHNVEFADIIFKDLEFGHHYARSTDRILDLPEKDLLKIVAEIKKHL